jgi:hypothetical protein
MVRKVINFVGGNLAKSPALYNYQILWNHEHNDNDNNRSISYKTGNCNRIYGRRITVTRLFKS